MARQKSNNPMSGMSEGSAAFVFDQKGKQDQSVTAKGKLSAQGNGTALFVAKPVLEASGFRQGDEVRVIAREGEITVRAADGGTEAARAAIDDVFAQYGPALRQLAK